LTEISSAPVDQWVQIVSLPEKGLYKHNFDLRHIGNTFIRSIHGGVSAAITELGAQKTVIEELGNDTRCEISSTSINYLRVTKDQDIFARAKITRITRRLAFVEVMCWQDDEAMPITQGQCTLRIFREE